MKMKLIKLMNNFHYVELTNGDRVYFSYETPIGYSTGVHGTVSKNVWSQTTGKHVNYLIRELGFDQISHEDFKAVFKIIF